MCYAKEEGGAEFISILDINKAFVANSWWNFRTKESMWRDFMKAKYYNKIHLVTAT